MLSPGGSRRATQIQKSLLFKNWSGNGLLKNLFTLLKLPTKPTVSEDKTGCGYGGIQGTNESQPSPLSGKSLLKAQKAELRNQAGRDDEGTRPGGCRSHGRAVMVFKDKWRNS
jgi:hypothetical protein